MQPNEYQDLTKETEIYSSAADAFLAQDEDKQLDWLCLAYCAGKLNGEAGEVAELVFKALRDGSDPGVMEPERMQNMFKELGDVLWYVARLADLCGFKLEDVMKGNIDKLMDRKDRGVLTGSGDGR